MFALRSRSVILMEIVRLQIWKLSTDTSASGPLVSQSSPCPPAHFWFREEYGQLIPRAMIQRARSTPERPSQSSVVWLFAFMASFVSTFIEKANAPARTDRTKMAIMTTIKAMPRGTCWSRILMIGSAQGEQEPAAVLEHLRARPSRLARLEDLRARASRLARSEPAAQRAGQ